LSTIAVVAKEMIRLLQELDVPPGVREDAALIRVEVDHCQTILQRMTGRAGRWMAEEHVAMNLKELVATTLDELTQAERVIVVLPPRAGTVFLRVPRESLSQALRGLLQNALDATQSDEIVRLTVGFNEQHVQLVVQDAGPGMAPEVLGRAGEPFFTTKEPGRGMGLGLFLTRSVIERLGGRLELHSEPGVGVTAVVSLPRK
jgi:two-component system sensor histidine kinase RegB